jgi:hypothetical protein
VRSLSSECPKGYWSALMPEETEKIIIKQIEKHESEIN